MDLFRRLERPLLPQAKRNISFDGQVGEQSVVLKDGVDVAAEWRQAVNARAVQPDLAGGKRLKPGDQS